MLFRNTLITGLAFLVAPATVLAQSEERLDRIKFSVGSSSVRDSDETVRLSGTMFRVSYNLFEPKQAQELRIGYDRFSSGGGGIFDTQYIWRFGKKQNGYYGLGLAAFEGGSGGSAVLGLNIGKNLFIESRSVVGSDDTSVSLNTVAIGFRF
jgi:hypothetical protein